MVDLELIKKRKAVYGGNFECIAKRWNDFLKDKEKLNGADVAEMMALMKLCRKHAIHKKLRENKESFNLKEALIDTEVDLANYKWIAKNYEEYKRL